MNTIMLQVSVQARYVFSYAAAELTHVFFVILIHRRRITYFVAFFKAQPCETRIGFFSFLFLPLMQYSFDGISFLELNCIGES